MERISDRNQNTLTFDYDAQGSPLAIRHSGGYHITLTIDDGRVVTLELVDGGEGGPDVTVKKYGYTSGNLTSTINSSQIPTQFFYDERLRITSWEDTNGSRYNYTYDERDRCISQGGEARHLTHAFAYDLEAPAWPGCRVTEATTAEGATSRFVVDEHCLIVAEVDPMGGEVRTSYDANQNITAFTDQLGRMTRISHNRLGQPIAVVGPDGAIIRYEYGALNLTKMIALPDGTCWRYTYDDFGNCTSVTDPSGNNSRSTYSWTGVPLTVTDALGHRTVVRCNSAGLPLELIDHLGFSTVWQRDIFGRTTARTDELDSTTRFAWSVEGLLVHRVLADGSSESWAHDGEGNCTSHTDQLRQVSRYEYTHFDLLSTSTAPGGARYHFSYDTSLRLVEVLNPLGLAWGYRYDAAGRLISETDFDGRTITYAHDAAGRLIARTNALGQSIVYEYDVRGQLVRKDVCGAVTEFEYDVLGNLARAISAESSLLLERDRSGNLVAETVDERTLASVYDETGRRTNRLTPAGATSNWTYDESGFLARLTASGRAIDFDRDIKGREITRRVGTNLTLDHAFDELGRLVTQSVATRNGHTIGHRAYTYRSDGHLTGIDDALTGKRSFDVDVAGRVTAVHAANWTETYAYDAAGNQIESDWPRTHPGHEATGVRSYSGTRIISAGHVRYEYDELGRTTLRQKTRLSRKPDTWRYEWDAEDRLTSVITPDGTRWLYTYDPLGRRTSKLRLAPDDETVVERVVFTWDGTTLCEQTTTSTSLPNSVTLTWDHQGFAPIAQAERISAVDEPQHEVDSRFFAIVTDLIGKPTELLDENGGIAWRARATLWGTTAWATNSSAYTPLRFPGQYHDPETGLHYNYFRHYDPETARYLSPDPLGLEPAPNPVAFVDNPHAWADPLGLAPCGGAVAPAGHVYRGGIYKWLKDPSTGYKRNIPGTEINHMPPNSVNGVPTNRGAAIQMDQADHYQTASWGRSHEARDYRAQQKALVDQGRYRDAIDMDIADIRSKFGDKYDNAIKEMIYFLPKGW
ncbi:RHS repeat-associated core domain-containing protein [Streptomyces sp. A5-4]|uniref:RHS repeat-associated core domain-containing protein n=1 Tax=Streptomyces sp. A5-4 TaxID=3384771 RepID=UPI003DA85410